MTNLQKQPLAMFRDSLETVFAMADLRGVVDPNAPKTVERVFVSDADEAHRLCLDGPGRVVVMSLDDVIACAMSGHPNANQVVYFAPVHAGFLQLVGRPGLMSIADLKGKKVAVDTDTGYASALYEMLAMHGLDRERDVTVVYAGATNLRYEKLMRGEFDATLLGSPFATLALAKGCVSLGRPRAILGGYQGTVFAARRDWLAANHQAAMLPVKCFRQTVEWAKRPDNRQVVEQMLAGLLAAQNAIAQAAAVAEELFGPQSEFTVDEKVRDADASVVVGLYEKARGVKLPADLIKRVTL